MSIWILLGIYGFILLLKKSDRLRDDIFDFYELELIEKDSVYYIMITLLTVIIILLGPFALIIGFFKSDDRYRKCPNCGKEQSIEYFHRAQLKDYCNCGSEGPFYLINPKDGWFEGVARYIGLCVVFSILFLLSTWLHNKLLPNIITSSLIFISILGILLSLDIKMRMFKFLKHNVQKMKEKRDVKGLIKCLSYKKDLNIQIESINALAEIRDKRAVEPLMRILDDPFINEKSIAMCEAAAKSLGVIGDARAVDLLVWALMKKGFESSNGYFDPLFSYYRLNSEAERALISIGEPSIEPLTALLKNEDKDVRNTAEDVLHMIKDKDYRERRLAERKSISTVFTRDKDSNKNNNGK